MLTWGIFQKYRLKGKQIFGPIMPLAVILQFDHILLRKRIVRQLSIFLMLFTKAPLELFLLHVGPIFRSIT